VIVSVRSVLPLRLGTSAAASSQRSLPTARVPNTTVVKRRLPTLNCLHCIPLYLSAQPFPLYIVKKPDSQAPVRKLAAQTLHSSARLGSPDRRVGRCLECWQWRPDTCNRIARHTPSVIGKVRFTRLFHINSGVHAPYHRSSKVSRLTVHVTRFP
jgi:hypothetical protein